MSKSWFALALFWIVLPAPSLRAADSVAYISVSRIFPRGIEPEAGREALTQSFQFGVYVEDHIVGVFGWDIGQTDSKRMAFTAGMQWFITDQRVVDPYVTVRYLYKLDGDNQSGWRGTVGASWNARPISKMDNLRFFVETGASYVYSDPRQLWYEIAHLGAAWHF